MHIRTFRAASLQDALEDIRRQMGEDASVLYTRQVREGWKGWLGKTSVEVTAGLRDTSEPKGRRDALPLATANGIHDPAASHPLESMPLRSGYPLELQDLRALLRLGGVEDASADRWVEATYHAGTASASPVEPGQWIDRLRQTVAQGLKIAGPLQVPIGERRIIALVGPTGVGKTTTIAKLAAGFRLEAKRKVALITIDTFRIAAVQQLRAYAEIMDLPMEVVQTADQMQPALQRLGDADLILIDTTGRSPRSDSRIDQLRHMLRMAGPHETHLVVSATTSRHDLESILDGFANVRPTATILTKLDETNQLASVLSVFDERALPISYVTAGQQVPDDIETADAQSLVQGLLAPHMLAPQTDSVARPCQAAVASANAASITKLHVA